jgi:drug/metabolite transporter (DMT)-like permease
MNDRHAYATLLLVILFWAGNYPVGKLGVGDLGPLTLTGGRALLAGPLLLLLARLTAPLARPLARADYVAFAILGGTGLVTNTTLWYWGLQYTTALNAGILGAAAPIFVSVASALLFGDRLGRHNWLGIGLTVLAVLITVAKGSLGVLLTLTMNRGDLIILTSQVAWITYSLYSRAAASALPPVWVMAGANLAAGLVLVPLALLVERPWQHWWAWRGWLVVLYGALPVTVGHLWFYQIVRTIGAGRAVTFLNLMPFAVLTMAWLLVGETIHLYHVIGAGLVAAGVYLVTRPA